MAGLVEGRCQVRPLSSNLVAVLIEHLGALRREVAVAVLFNPVGVAIDLYVTGSGEIGSARCRYRPLFERVFQSGARGFVLVHNHPSGDPTPSARDIAATASLRALGRVLDIDVYDHVVVGARSAVSMRQAGML